MSYRLRILFLLLVTLPFIMKAQDEDDRSLVQFSGVVVTADSLNPVPFTHILVKGTNRGTMADYHGFFSFVAEKGDTVRFSAVGFTPDEYILPDTLKNNRYSLIQVMKVDTVTLAETVIFPWPTVKQFKQAFVELDIPDDDMERARKNLALAEMKERMWNAPMDGSMNYKNYIDQKTSKLYYAGQLPPNNLLNPLAWAQFIKAWKEGRFKLDM
ncbi:MAG: carboxypeptidase-like regulatory domain-containing protein [Bacteroidales bacterium]|nr:carboxypeptidase-like regulatory domain-containing protein [Bacteroidales bacterium]